MNSKMKRQLLYFLFILIIVIQSVMLIIFYKNESQSKENLDSWIGYYEFSEGASDPPMGMDYEIRIYEEEGEYYADLYQGGQTTMVRARAKVYGDNEWISLIFEEYLQDHNIGLNCKGNCVLLSFRCEEEDIYTYWGETEPLLYDDEYCGEIYFKKVDKEN